MTVEPGIKQLAGQFVAADEGGLDMLRISPRGDYRRQDGCRAGLRPGAGRRS
jgi:hypothetical protein